MKERSLILPIDILASDGVGTCAVQVMTMNLDKFSGLCVLICQ